MTADPATKRPGGVVFLGTAEFAVPALERLCAAGERVSLVVTQPDRPKGRGRKLVAPPIRTAAERLDLPVYQPSDINGEEALEHLRQGRPEFLVVVAYGQLLKRPLLELPASGVVNVHPSLLPRHRGPAPVAWSLLCGDEEAGVSTMFLDDAMDAGPVLLQQSVPLDSQRTRGEVESELAELGADVLVRTLVGLRSERIVPRPQSEELATFSRRITREMRAIPWSEPAIRVRNHVHALSPAPGAVSRLGDALLKVLRVRPSGEGGAPAGTVLPPVADGPVVACGEGAVVLLEVQPEGKRRMSGAEFCRGGGAAPGDRFTDPWNG